MFRFQHMEYLIGLAALPLLAALLYLLIRWKRRSSARIGDPALVRELIKNFSPLRFFIKFGLVTLAFVLLVLGAGNLQKPGAMENVHRQGVDVMLVLDVSRSMLARDIKPDRLERAKQLLYRLSDKLENDRLGLVLFAGRAYMQMPLTPDHGAARMYIQSASPAVVPTQGTVIADALRMANNAFNSKERKYKAIVLLSDGEDHDPDALKVAKDLAQDGVMINTVGIGSPDGSPIVDPATGELKKDDQGNTVISKLNESELQQLADVSNGRYIRLDNIDDAEITMTQQLDSIEKKAMTDSEFVDYKSYFQWFLAITLLLLLCEYFLPERKSIPVDRNNDQDSRKTGSVGSPRPAAGAPLVAGAVLLLAVLLPFAGLAQNTDALIRSGNRFYKKKDLDQSRKKYEQAVQQSPGNPTAHYNLGNAEYRQNSYDSAAHSYQAAAGHAPDSGFREKSLYNQGVALVRQQQLQGSIDAWKQALKLDPTDNEARENLEKALLQLKQQQQQQQKDKKDQQDKKDQKDQKQQPQPQPKPSKLTKQQVEQLLKALQQKEKDVQNKMNENKPHTLSQPDKDW